MRHLAIRIPVALATFLIGLAAAGLTSAPRPDAASYSEAEREVLQVEREYVRAHLERDVSSLDRILADDFVLGPVMGRVTTKAARLELLRDPDFEYLSFDPAEVKVEVGDDKAVVTGVATLRVRYADRVFRSPRYGFTRLYEKRQGRWQITSVEIAPGPRH